MLERRTKRRPYRLVGPENNDFAIAEEVTLKGGYQRRPDLVLYINGLAIGVIELKRSSVDVVDGIRQLITQPGGDFQQGLFHYGAIRFAGNDSQGLRYARPAPLRHIS